MSRSTSAVLDEIARDLDMVVYALERPEHRQKLETERARILRELEQLRDRLWDVVRDLDP